MGIGTKLRPQALHQRHPIILHIIICLVITGVAIGGSFALANRLLIRDIKFTLSLQDNSSPVIRLTTQILGVDAVEGTLMMDWYPLYTDCSSNVNVFLDTNLLDNSSPNMPSTLRTNNPPSQPTFNFNSSEACNSTAKTSLATFRTVSKLVGNFSHSRRSSQQAYPYDLYFAQISMFAEDAITNASVPMDIALTWGTAVNFHVSMDVLNKYDTKDGLFVILNVSRSHAVQLFVIFIIVANWIVTIVFMSITVACMLWHEAVVKDMFILPLSALFAFTSVRANMPGAPQGFGAYIDFVGILPNLLLMTICTAILLFLILIRRMKKEVKEKREAMVQPELSTGEYSEVPKQEEPEGDNGDSNLDNPRPNMRNRPSSELTRVGTVVGNRNPVERRRQQSRDNQSVMEL